MATFKNAIGLQAAALLAWYLLMSRTVEAQNAWELTDWTESHATFYGDITASATMGGSCGYGDLWWRGYGLNTAALSTALWNGGLSCGACFELKCNINSTSTLLGDNPQWCYPDAGSVIITATNMCPPNWAIPSDNGGWCNPPRTHFDLPMPTFLQMSQEVAGIIPILYRRVDCVKTGGIQFYLDGNYYFNLFLVYNVAGGGDIASVQIQGDQTDWYPMTINWGENWQLHVPLIGQCLSFIITLCNGQSLTIMNLTSSEWGFGQTYQSSLNF